MPMKSKAQWRYMFANHPRIAKRWAEHTKVDFQNLPERVEEGSSESEEKGEEKEKKAMSLHRVMEECATNVLKQVGSRLVRKKIAEASRAAMIRYLDTLARKVSLTKQASIRATQLYLCAGVPLTESLRRAFKIRPDEAGLLAADLVRGVTEDMKRVR